MIKNNSKTLQVVKIKNIITFFLTLFSLSGICQTDKLTKGEIYEKLGFKYRLRSEVKDSTKVIGKYNLSIDNGFGTRLVLMTKIDNGDTITQEEYEKAKQMGSMAEAFFKMIPSVTWIFYPQGIVAFNTSENNSYSKWSFDSYWGIIQIENSSSLKQFGKVPGKILIKPLTSGHMIIYACINDDNMCTPLFLLNKEDSNKDELLIEGEKLTKIVDFHAPKKINTEFQIKSFLDGKFKIAIPQKDLKVHSKIDANKILGYSKTRFLGCSSNNEFIFSANLVDFYFHSLDIDWNEVKNNLINSFNKDNPGIKWIKSSVDYINNREIIILHYDKSNNITGLGPYNFDFVTQINKQMIRGSFVYNGLNKGKWSKIIDYMVKSIIIND